MWFYVAALSLDHVDAIQAIEGHTFDAPGLYKDGAPTAASSRARTLPVGYVPEVKAAHSACSSLMSRLLLVNNLVACAFETFQRALTC